MPNPNEKTVADYSPRGPVYTEPFELDGRKGKYKLRLLDFRETDFARASALRHNFEQLTAVGFEAEQALTLMTAHAANFDSFRDWTDTYILVTALCTADGSPAISGETPKAQALELSDEFTTTEQDEFIRRYLELLDDNDPGTMTEEDIDEEIERLGKTPDFSTLKQYGSSVLRYFVRTMATRLASAEDKVVELEKSLEQVEPIQGTVTQLEPMELKQFEPQIPIEVLTRLQKVEAWGERLADLERAISQISKS